MEGDLENGAYKTFYKNPSYAPVFYCRRVFEMFIIVLETIVNSLP